MSKQPYIPKEFYPAVMFACKMIDKGEEFNKAVSTSAKYYKVDKTELTKQVNLKLGKKSSGRKFKYYTSCRLTLRGESDYPVYSKPEVVRATKKENVSKHYQIYNGENLSFGIALGEYTTKSEAESYLQRDFYQKINSKKKFDRKEYADEIKGQKRIV